MYRRRCDTNNVVANKTFRDKLDLATETGEIRLLQMADQLGPVAVRSIF